MRFDEGGGKIPGNLNDRELNCGSSAISLKENKSKNFVEDSKSEKDLVDSNDEKGCKEENQIILEEVFTSDYNVTDEEIAEYAQRLGIDSHSEPQLLSLARNALLAPLPSAWTPVKDKQYGIYYFNKRTGESSWTHPVDASFREYLAKSMGCKFDKTATDTDSCVEDLKTEEAFSSLKKESNLDSGSSLSNASISSKNSPRKGTPFFSNSGGALGHCSDKVESKKERGEGNPTGLETKELLSSDPKVEPYGNPMAFPAGFPPLGGAGGKNVLPSISASKLTPFRRQTIGPSPLGPPQGSPNISPARVKPQGKIDLKSSLSILTASATKGPPSSGVSSYSYATNPIDSSSLKPIMRQPGDRLRDSSPEKNKVTFGGEESYPVDDFNSADEETSEEEKRNIKKALGAKENLFGNTLADANSFKTNSNNLHDSISAASKIDPWTDNDNLEMKEGQSSTLSQFQQEQNKVKEKAKAIGKEFAASGGRTTLNPVSSSATKLSETLTTVAGSTSSATSLINHSVLAATQVNNKHSLAATQVNKPTPVVAQASKSQLATTNQNLPKSTSNRNDVSSKTPEVKPDVKQDKGLSVVPEAEDIKSASGKTVTTKSTAASNVTKATPAQTSTKNNTTPVSKGLNAANSNNSSKPKPSPSQQVEPPGKITMNDVTPQNKNITSAAKSASALPAASPSLKTKTSILPSASSSNKPNTSTNSDKILNTTISGKEEGKPAQQAQVKKPLSGGGTTITRQSAHELDLELEESDRPKRNTKPLEKLVSKFGKKTEGAVNNDEDDDEDAISLQGTRPSFNTQNKNESRGCKFCHCGAAREDFYQDTLRGMSRSASEEDFLRRRREELYRQDELEAELKRKRELTLMSATLDIERSMGVLLKERQLELKREHIKSLTLFKEDMESNLSEVKREAEQKEVMERQQQMSRLNYVQEQYQRELEALQLSHQKSLEAMKQQNEKELDEMKRELRRYMLIHKEEFEAKLKETTLDKEVKEILTPNARPRSRTSSGDHSRPSGSVETKVSATPLWGSSENATAKRNYDDIFLAEFKNLRNEISEIKNINRTNAVETTMCGETSERNCKYGSKYRDIRKRYSSLRKRIKEQKLKQKSQLGLDSNSSTSSESSPNKLHSAERMGHENTTNDSSTESIADHFEDLNFSNITVPGINNYTKIKTSTPKKFNLTTFKSKKNDSLLDDPGGTDWLTMEGNRILSQTENFLSSIKYSDNELEFDIDNYNDDLNQFILEREKQFNMSHPLADTMEPLGICRTPPTVVDVVDNYGFHSLGNISDVHTSTKSELDLILENISKKAPEEPRARRKLLAWADDDDVVPNLISNQLSYQRPLQSNHQSDDMFAINNYLKSKWETYFGGSSSPFTGRSGWPSKHLSQTVLSNDSMNRWEPTISGYNHVTSNKHNISRQIENIRSWLNETQELTESIAD